MIFKRLTTLLYFQRMKFLFLIISLFVVSRLNADGLPNAPYLYAVGTSSREIAADQIRLSFSLETRNKDASLAAAEVESKSKKVFSLLAKYGVGDKDIEAASVSNSSKYDDDTGKEFLGYEVERNFHIVLREVAHYGKLAKELLEIPVTGIKLTGIGSSQEQALTAEIEAEARKSARKNADEIAASFGSEVIGVYAVSPISFRELSRQWPLDSTVEHFALMDARQQSFSFVIPPVKILRESHVIFLIREKVTK